MMREGFAVARCTVAWLTREMGLAAVIRSKPVHTTVNDKAARACSITSSQVLRASVEQAVGIGLYLRRDFRSRLHLT